MNELEIMPGEAERFIIKVDDFKQSLGRWYTLLARKIVPVVLFIIPVNVVLGEFFDFLAPRFPNVNFNGTILLVSWIVFMLGFLSLTIFTPKVATAAELILGFTYLFFAFRRHLFNTPLGISVLVAMIVFLIAKLVFLGFEIYRMKEFAGDRKNNIERDESGRIIRATEEEVFFTKEKKADDNVVPVAAREELFFSEEKEDGKKVAVAGTPDDLVFSHNDETEGSGQFVVAANEEFFFANNADEDDGPSPIAAPDDDFIF